MTFSIHIQWGCFRPFVCLNLILVNTLSDHALSSDYEYEFIGEIDERQAHTRHERSSSVYDWELRIDAISNIAVLDQPTFLIAALETIEVFFYLDGA